MCIYDLMRSGNINLNPLIIFLIGAAGSMALEYLTSVLLEKFFHARWWDYSRLPLNIEGRTSVPTAIAFGIAAILIMKVMIPVEDRLLMPVPEIVLDILALIFVSLVSIDITLTVTGLTDFHKRVSEVDEHFQQHMTEAVERFYASQSYFHHKAVGRIVSFKLPARKLSIAKKLIERKLGDLINDIIES